MESDQAIQLEAAISALSERVDEMQAQILQVAEQLRQPTAQNSSTVPHPAKPEPYVDLSPAAMKAPKNTAEFEVNHRPTPGRITRLHPGVSPDQEARAQAEVERYAGDEAMADRHSGDE